MLYAIVMGKTIILSYILSPTVSWSLLSMRVPLTHPFCEYRHKSTHILPTRFIELHFCRRQYGCNFNYFDVVGFEITHDNAHCAIQRHRFRYQSKALFNFLLVNNSNFIYPSFPSYSGLLINFRFRQGVLVQSKLLN